MIERTHRARATELQRAQPSMDVRFFTGRIHADPVEVVLFDAESTLVADEFLGNRAGDLGRQITDAAMNNQITFEESLARRLDLVKPSLRSVNEGARHACELLVPDARETIQVLGEVGIVAGIVSGGIGDYVRVVANSVGIDPDNVYANELKYCPTTGSYQGLKDTPMAHDDGKARIIEAYQNSRGLRSVLVGDGANDAAARTVCPVVRAGWFEDRSQLDGLFDASITLRDGVPAERATLTSVFQLLDIDRQEYIVRAHPHLAARAGIAA